MPELGHALRQPLGWGFLASLVPGRSDHHCLGTLPPSPAMPTQCPPASVLQGLLATYW